MSKEGNTKVEKTNLGKNTEWDKVIKKKVTAGNTIAKPPTFLKPIEKPKK